MEHFILSIGEVPNNIGSVQPKFGTPGQKTPTPNIYNKYQEEILLYFGQITLFWKWHKPFQENNCSVWLPYLELA